MKRLLTAAVAALIALPAGLRAEGPDDQYIEIYKLIQDGDQAAAIGQPATARERYVEAASELKKLQASYPNWNVKLVEYRLNQLAGKLTATPAAETPARAAAPAAAATTTTPPARPAPVQTLPVRTPPTAPIVAAPQAPAPVLLNPQPEVDDRDSQIRALQDQVGRLQNDKNILEAKLREALAAQPAAIDPRELARAEQRINILEKEKEVLRVSAEVAEARAARASESGATAAKKALAEANQRLAQQNETLAALRQEKDVLERRLQSTVRSHEDTLKTLQTENDGLKQRLAQRASAPAPKPASDSTEKELASTKAALQSSRDMVTSLQVRLRALEEERDRLDKTRRDLETRVASTAPLAPSAPAPSSADAAQLKRLQKERDDLQKKLSETTRDLAEARSSNRKPRAPQAPGEDVSALRARLEALEARKVPYTPEELALFKKPQELAAVTLQETPQQKSTKELPESAAPLLAEAQRAFMARRFDEAEKKYQEVLRLDEKNVGTLQRLAAAQLEQNRPKDAEANLKLALAQNASDPRTLLLLGIAKFDQDRFDEALDHFSRSAQLDPQNAETQNYLGITLSQKGQLAAAETALRKAIQLAPGYKEAHYNLAVVYATQQPPFLELARWHYQKALAFGHPQNPELEKLMERKAASPK